MSGRAVGESLAAILVLTLIAVLVARCLGGCATLSPTEQADITIQTGMYAMALDHCREQGRISGKFVVYEACEKAESRRICQERAYLQQTWKRCAEVGLGPDGGVR